MSASLFSLLVWAPVLLLALIFGIVFAILGYKRGAAKAAISVAVTLLTAVISILLAKLLSSALGSAVRSLAEKLTNQADLGAYADLIDSMTAAFAALLLFAPVYILLLLLFKNLTSLVFTAKMPKPKSAGNRVGGLAIGLFDALLMTFLILLPLYGTVGLVTNGYEAVAALTEQSAKEESDVLAARVPAVRLSMTRTAADPRFLSAPVVKTTMNLPENDLYGTDGFGGFPTNELKSGLKAVGASPLVKLAAFGPFSAAYDNLFAFQYNGQTVSVSKIVKTVTDVVSAVAAYRDGGADTKAAALKAIDDLEKLVAAPSGRSKRAISRSSATIRAPRIPRSSAGMPRRSFRSRVR